MRKKPLFQGLLVILILIIGSGLSYYLLRTKPELPRRKPKPRIPLVKVIKVSPHNYRIRIEGFGTVYPLRTGQIIPEVSGKLIYLSPKLVAGGFFRAGEVLARIDPRDYQTALVLAEAELAEAQKTVAELEAEASAAKTEWQKILKLKAPVPPLVAKVPELQAAKARLEAARAKVAKARRDLERTTIKAPFSGMVVETQVELDQYVSPGMTLAKVYQTEAVEIKVSLETQYLPWLLIPGFNTKGPGSPARVYLRLAKEHVFSGRIVRAAAQADEKTRLLDVFVRVKRPFARKPPLLPGFFVRVEMLGQELKRVFVLPREVIHLEKGNWVVWIVKKGRLFKQEVDPIYLDKTRAVIRGLAPGTQVLVTRVAGAVPGMKVRLKP